MMQSDIFSFVLQSLKKELSSADGIKFEIVDDIDRNKDFDQVQFSVTDIFQTSNDKTGQRIVVDEQRFEVPAMYEIRISINLFAAKLEDKLSLFGFVAQFFKEHTVYDCGEYNWHGNESKKFILEPLVRRETMNDFKDFFHLDYKVEVQLNSVKGEHFVRVEKKDLRTKQVNNK